MKECNHDLTFTLRCSSFELDECPEKTLPGTTIRVAYDNWFPVSFVKDDGSFGGLFFDVLHIIASRLKLEIEFIKNRDPGIWGTMDENRTWTGLLGMIHRGEADLSPSGFSPTSERGIFFDFSVEVISMKYSLFTRRPTGTRVSLQNYFWEFDRYIWASIAAVSFFLIIGFFFLLHTLGDSQSISKATAVVLRALLYKGTLIPATTASLKIMMLTIFALSTVLTVSYRGCLNAFLAVVVPSVRIKTFNDVLEHTSGLALWPGSQLENIFEASEQGSAEKKLYNQWQSDEKGRILSYESGLHQVIQDDYVLLGEEESIRVLPEFSCDIVLVEGFQFKTIALAIPFAPGSHLKSAFTKEILKLHTQGIVERLFNWYFTRHMRKEVDCLEAHVDGLGFANVFTPFACLAVGALGGVAIVVLEWAGSNAMSAMGILEHPVASPRARLRKESIQKQVSMKISNVKAVVLSQEISDAYKLALLEDMFHK